MMQRQISNYVAASTMLWLDHLLCNVGSGFFNVGTKFYSTNQIYNGYYAYSAPYKQIIYDNGVNGATVPTGIYINNVFVGTGVSGFVGYNYEEGLALFNTNQSSATISGNYSVKELAIKDISEQDEYLLYETKYFNKNRVPQSAAGLYTNQQPYPIIFVRNASQDNDPFALGGEKLTQNTIRLTILADSSYLLDAVSSLIADQEDKYIPLLSANDFPNNPIGGLYQTGWNYAQVITGKVNQNQASFIKDSNTANFNSNLLSELKKINPNVYPSIIELNLETIRFVTNYVRC